MEKYLDKNSVLRLLQGIKTQIDKSKKNILDTKGVANGIASLDANGNVPLSQLGNVDTVLFEIVHVLPTELTEQQKNHIFIVPRGLESESDKNTYKEYIYTGEDLGHIVPSYWEELGEFTSEVDLKPYSKKSETTSPSSFRFKRINEVGELALLYTDATGKEFQVKVPRVNSGNENDGLMTALDKYKLDQIDTEALSQSITAANIAAGNTNEAIRKCEVATAGAEKVNANLTDDNVVEITDRKGTTKSVSLYEAVKVGNDVTRIKQTLGAYSDREDVVLTPKETNKAISSDGVKVAKQGWAIAEFTAEKGNEYLFKPNVIDGSVCVFAEYITSIETRGIDYTYTYNEDGTIATATATYRGNTHTYTYEWTVEAGVNTPTIKEGDTVIKNLPMTYETKVGTYSPLVKLNEDAELPVDGYCRYMSHFKGNSSIKIVVSYKVGIADLTMKVLRDGVLASISTQLGNLSQKEDETRKKIEDLHGNWVDLLFKKDWTILIDNTSLNIKGCKKTRVYPKSYLNLNGSYKKFTPLVWADISNLKGIDGMTGRFTGGLQGCKNLKTIYAAGTDVSKFTSLSQFFEHCSSLQSIDVSTWDVSNVTDFSSMFAYCSSLQSIDVSAWDVGNATTFYRMFNNNGSLQSIDVGAWDTSKVTTIEEMFAMCSSLKSIDISAWDVGNVTSIKNMFYACTSLESIDVSTWDVRKLKTFTGFLQQNIIKSLDLSGWDLESCTDLRFTEYSLPWVTLKLGPRFFHCPLVTSANWTGLSSWTDASVKESLVTNSYDRKANGLPDLTLILHTNTKSVLSEDDIAAMTAKGYIIA